MTGLSGYTRFRRPNKEKETRLPRQDQESPGLKHNIIHNLKCLEIQSYLLSFGTDQQTRPVFRAPTIPTNKPGSPHITKPSWFGMTGSTHHQATTQHLVLRSPAVGRQVHRSTGCHGGDGALPTWRRAHRGGGPAVHRGPAGSPFWKGKL